MNSWYNILCHVLNSILFYISGLCTAAVEWQELHEDNAFTLNSEILQWSQSAEHVTYVIYHFFPAIHSDEYCMVLVATIKVTEKKKLKLRHGRCTAKRNLQIKYFLNSLSLHQPYPSNKARSKSNTNEAGRYSIVQMIMMAGQDHSLDAC